MTQFNLLHAAICGMLNEGDATTNAGSLFTEASNVTFTGSKFAVTAIEAGLSKNRRFYSDAVLREAVNLFKGVNVVVKSDESHVKGEVGSFSGLIGQFTEVRFVEGIAPNTGRIEGILKVLDTNNPDVQKMVAACQNKLTESFGVSISAFGELSPNAKIDGFSEAVNKVEKITAVTSLDVVLRPAAKGRVTAVLESEPTPTTAHTSTPAQLNTAAIPVDVIEAMNVIKKSALDVQMQEAISKSNLPEMVKSIITARFASKQTYTLQEVTEAISDCRKMLSTLTESGKVNMGGVQLVSDQRDNHQKLLDDFFEGKADTFSIKECYIQVTGDKRLTGRLSEAVNTALFPEMLGDAMYKKLRKSYLEYGKSYFEDWRFLTDMVIPFTDFKERTSVQFGGYGDLPIVLEGGSYNALSSPTEEASKYKPAKRGGTETVTLEALTNDDVGAIIKIPTKLAMSARRTFYKFVMGLITNNSQMGYDSKSLFHNDHGNLLTAALSESAIDAARLLLNTQKEPNSNDMLLNPLVHLWVPPSLETTANNIFRRGANQDPTFIQAMAVSIHLLANTIDLNNWFVSTDANMIPTVEVGFLNNQQEPQLFIQDNPSYGSMFTNDAITYKMRHVYGASLVDHRGIVGSIVP